MTAKKKLNQDEVHDNVKVLREKHGGKSNVDHMRGKGKPAVFSKDQAKVDLDQVIDKINATSPEDLAKARKAREQRAEELLVNPEQVHQSPEYQAVRKEALDKATALLRPVDGVTKTLHLDQNGKEVPEPLKLEEMTQRIVDQAIANMELPPGTLGFKPQVTINGKVVEPFETIPAKGRGADRWCHRLYVEGDLIEIYQHREYPLDIPQLRAYKVVVENQEVILLLDEYSSVTITDDSPDHPWGTRKSDRKRQSVAVLLNSASNNDRFFGQSLLVNVESSLNLLNNATLRCHNDLDTLRNFHLDKPERVKGDFLREKSRRMKVSEAQFKHQTVLDTDLDGGCYMNGTLEQCVVQSRHVVINDCTITRCSLIAAAIKLHKTTLEDCQARADGRVDIRKQRFNGKSFYPFSALYLINKFAYTSIPLADAYQDLELVRTSKNTYELALGGTVAKLTTPVNDYDLRKAISAVKRDEEVNQWDQDPFSQSLTQYVVDCITSRIKLVSALDVAVDAAEHLTGNMDRYESPYGN